jgi:4,5-DOPA dioxygenase extradiol
MSTPPTPMPAVFIGHGNPMNAIQDNGYTRAWRDLARHLPRPRGVLVVSAHWYLPGTWVTAMERPRTIHDFGGFPEELFRIEYPAPGDPALARRVQQVMAPLDIGLDQDWGLDHGTWSVLCHLFPQADVPVVQLSLDETRPATFHYAAGKLLDPLRDEGILVVGSGNLVHNLHAYGWGRHVPEPFDWAARFEAEARHFLVGGIHGPLVAYDTLGRDALLSVPTPEHYLPLLYVLGLQRPGEAVTFPVEGVDGGSVSMLSIRVG